MRCLVAFVLGVVASCTAEPEAELAPTGPVQEGKGDAYCPTVPARIAPTTLPLFSCGPLDATNAAIAADVNRFWGSNVIACACGPDFPKGCEGAFSLFTTGYVWIGVDFINTITRSAGSYMPAEYAVAHEFGHEIQGHYNARGPFTLQRELSADCLAGYYLGSLVCRGTATQHDLIATLTTACVIADGTGDPIVDLGTHGTCEQRVQSVSFGIEAYLNGQLPLDACAI